MTALADTLKNLELVVGEGHLLTATDTVSSYRLDGQQPLGVVAPGSREEVAAILKAATQARFTVLVRGAGRHLHLGSPPGPIGLVMSLARLKRIVEYDAENLTVTAEAGVTLDEVQRLVGQRGQMLPLDPPGSDQATLGGIAATNLAGPLRMRYGAPRDLLIGLRVALADGSLVKTGGKTVKNVAGYELGKLFIGSFGSLGAICEVTVRLAPVPEARAMLAAVMPLERAGELAAQLLASRLDVGNLSVCNYAAVRRMGMSLPITPTTQMWVMCAGLLGDRQAIARQERDIRGLVGSGCGRVDGEEALAAWDGLREAPYPRDPSAIVARAGVPPAAACEIAAIAGQWDKWWLTYRAGDGLVYLGPPAGLPEAEAQARLTTLRKLAEEQGGYLVLESGPTGMKRSFGVWGEVQNLDLMQLLKERYDPEGTLGCGRFVGGL
jgi:glycolate oxidase FAD binding subunit